MRSLGCVVCAVLLAACSSSPKPVAAPPEAPPSSPVADQPGPAPAPAPAEKVMSGDTPSADADGNTFIVPDGWKVRTAGAMTVLTSPEGDSHFALVAVSAASNEAA